MGKTVLIVFAHTEKGSFNGSLYKTALETLSALGHSVLTSDLYAMDFQPVIGRHDVIDPVDPENFVWGREFAQAQKEGRLAADIIAEQAKVRAADLVIFQFPMYWMGFPAIMKGWLDRVMCIGFASQMPDSIFDQGLLKGKRTLLSFTVGGTRIMFSDRGLWGDIDVNVWPLLHGILGFTGSDVMSPHVVYGLDGSIDAADECFSNWRRRLENIFDEKPLYFPKMADFRPVDDDNPLKGLILKDEILKLNEVESTGPTVGQHVGKPIPSGSLTTARY